MPDKMPPVWPGGRFVGRILSIAAALFVSASLTVFVTLVLVVGGNVPESRVPPPRALPRQADVPVVGAPSVPGGPAEEEPPEVLGTRQEAEPEGPGKGPGDKLRPPDKGKEPPPDGDETPPPVEPVPPPPDEVSPIDEKEEKEKRTAGTGGQKVKKKKDKQSKQKASKASASKTSKSKTSKSKSTGAATTGSSHTTASHSTHSTGKT